MATINKKKWFVVIGGIVTLFIVIPFLFFVSLSESKKSSCTERSAEKISTITFGENEVYPTCSLVTSGQEVIWVNQTERTVYVSSNPHPIHTDNREISGGKFSLLLAPGEMTNVTLTKKGTFGFHDHLRPTHSGTIIVN
jgi:hypothetical protein